MGLNKQMYVIGMILRNNMRIRDHDHVSKINTT